MFNFLEGEVLLIDKPYEWSSFDVVKKIKGQLKKHLKIKKIKVGHAGTLDPLATGLLIVCTGKKTKTIEKLMAEEKEYIAYIKLGGTTPSYDLETEIDQTFEISHITIELINTVLQQFLGEQNQLPPVFSAKRINGKRAYEYARKGEEVEIKPNTIKIHDLEVLKFEDNVLEIRVSCSKGTYIRSLAYDIGIALKSGGHLIGLRRTKSGDYSVEEALDVDQFSAMLENMSKREDKVE